MRFLLGLSLLLNGLLAGLVVGHLTTISAERCECRRIREADEVDRGPFPTGWVVPDGSAKPRPSGDAP
jgi:hypothetical protein